ncbi:MAG: T9SS type A sorting domain-containing protein [Salinibacter sp.]
MFASRTPLFAVLVGGMLLLFAGTGSAQAQNETRLQSVGLMSVEDVSASVLETAQASVNGPDGAKKDGPLSAVGLELAVLYHQYQATGSSGVLRMREEDRPRPKAVDERARRGRRGRVISPLSADGQSVAVEAIAAGDPARLLQDLQALGLTDGVTAGNVVGGRLPISAIDEAASLASLRGMVPSYARVYVGSVGSEADTAHATDQVRRATGLDGSGQKVCAMSDSYNQNSSVPTTASQDVKSGDLPGNGNPEGNTTPVDVVDDSDSKQGDEGRAMLQLIHDIAPGAHLGFHTALPSLPAFASGVRDLADADCDIIVDDIRYNTEPFYQDGLVSNAIDDVVNNDGVAYFSSAGNDGQNSYEAPFRNSGQSGVLSSSSTAHDFDPSDGVDTEQAITIKPGGSFQIFSFQWTDPSAQTSGSVGPDTDIDIALVDGSGTIKAQSSINNIEDGRPFESLKYSNDSDTQTTLNLVIELAAGPEPDQVKYVYTGSDFSVKEYDTLGPTIYGHPMAKGAMAVAAAPFYNTERYNDNSDPAALESFSSKGGIRIRFNQNGGPVVPPETREKPNVTGADGTDNTFFGFDISNSFFGGIDGDVHPNFFGTSAAAPNVAAIAALIGQARPGFTPSQIYSRLEDTAEDVTVRENRAGNFVEIASGRDPWSGHGFVQALDAVPEPVIANLDARTTSPTDGTVELSWSVSGDPVDRYEVQRKYFGGSFETVATPEGPPVTLDTLGLGVFSFRVNWVRVANGDTTRGTSAAAVDTLGVQGLTTEVVGTDDKGRRTVEVSWSVPRGTQNFTYRVERQTGKQGPFEGLGTTDQTTFQAERQVPGTYNYRVVSVDDRGNRLTSAPKSRQIELKKSAFAVGPYPNPVRNTASLDLTAQSDQSVTVEIYNTLGKRLYRERRKIKALTPVTLSVDAGRWSSGMYFLRVRGAEFTKTRKMIIVR